MKYLILLIVILLTGCDSSYTVDNYENIPDELKDCRFFTIEKNLLYLHITRCPNSQTTTNYIENKTTKTTVVIDGVEYIKK